MSLKPDELQILKVPDAVKKLLSRAGKIAVGFKISTVAECRRPGRTTHDAVSPMQAC